MTLHLNKEEDAKNGSGANGNGDVIQLIGIIGNDNSQKIPSPYQTLTKELF